MAVARRSLPSIVVAPTGARRRKSDHANLPVTNAEIVAEAKACFAAGAAGIHAHVRGADQAHSLDPGLYRELTAMLAQEVPDMVVQLTSESAGIYSAAEQRAVLQELRPPLVSIALREMTREPDAAVTRDFYHWAQAEGVDIQHILYSVEDVEAMRDAVDSGLIPADDLELILVLGQYGPGRDSAPEDLIPLLRAKIGPLERAGWMACAFGRNETACLVQAAVLGGKMRIGMENNLLMADGSLAPNNAARVAELVAALADTKTRQPGHAAID